MKTAEEKANKYVEKTILALYSDSELMQDFVQKQKKYAKVDYLAGYNEAMRWRDPKEELPENGSLILTKIGDDINLVDICRYMGGRFTLYYKNQYSDYASKPMFREDLTSSITYWRPIE